MADKAEDASFSRETDAEEVNNGSYRREDEPDEEGQENKVENVMEEEEQLMMELQDLDTIKGEHVAELKNFWEQHYQEERQIDTSTNTTLEISSITNKTSCDESTSFSQSEKHVTSSRIDNSEVHRMRELNERLYKTITSLTSQNNSLKLKVERLTKKKSEISSISLEEEKTNRAEEIEDLEEKNKSLNQMLTDLQERLNEEKNRRNEAENKVWSLERVKQELNLEIKKLEKNIKRKKEMISKLEQINETENEQTSDKLEIISNGGINADIVDGIGIDMGQLRKTIFKKAEKKFTDIERKYKTQMEELTKTVTEKEAELSEARKKNSEHTRLIEDYKLQISSFNERLAKAEKLHLEEISRLEKEIQKSKEAIKAMEEKTQIHSQTVKETTKVELDIEMNIYKEYLDLMAGRFKIRETDKSAGGEEILKTMKKTEIETKYSEAYSHQESHKRQGEKSSVSQHEEAKNHETKYSDGDNSDDGQNNNPPEESQSESDLKGENEGDNQGLGGSPGTVVPNQGWNGTKDWSEHFEQRQTLQKPDPTSVGQTESDPETDNEEDDQGPKHSDGHDDSDDGQLD